MRGIAQCIRQNTVTMIDYLASVSSLPDQFSLMANTSSFLSGPDKHDRLHVIHSLRERLTGAENTIPTLYKDAIPLLPYALDVPKHLAILSSSVVRNTRSGTAVAYGARAGVPGSGFDGWTLGRFSGLCFDVEAQALKSVATLAQGAASAGAFGGPRMNRSVSVSSTGGYNPTGSYQSGSTVHPAAQPTSSHSLASGSRGMTPTVSGRVTTPTQTQIRRPTSSRAIMTPITAAAPPSPSSNTPSPTTKPSISLAIPPSHKKRRSTRPATAPSSTSMGRDPNEDVCREPQMRQAGPEVSPAGPFRHLPPDRNDPKRPEDVALPDTPVTPQRFDNNARHSTAPAPGYQTIHRSESEGFMAFHHPTDPSRFQGSTEALKVGGEKTEKTRPRSSSSRIRDFMRRPATSSGTTASRPSRWGEHSPHSSSGDELGAAQSRKRGSRGAGSTGNSSGEGYPAAGKRGDRPDTGANGSGGTGEPKKKKGIFSWLGGKK